MTTKAKGKQETMKGLYCFSPFIPQHQYVYSSYCSLYVSFDTDKVNLCLNPLRGKLSFHFRLSPNVGESNTEIGSRDGEQQHELTEKPADRKRKHHSSDKHSHRRKSKKKHKHNLQQIIQSLMTQIQITQQRTFQKQKKIQSLQNQMQIYLLLIFQKICLM